MLETAQNGQWSFIASAGRQHFEDQDNDNSPLSRLARQKIWCCLKVQTVLFACGSFSVKFGTYCKAVPTVVYRDNQSSLVWNEDSGLRKAEHISILYNFSRLLYGLGMWE